METHFPEMETTPSRVARDRVMADLKALAADSETLLRATANDASDKAKEARVRLSAALERAKATYADLQQRGLATAREAAQKTDHTIRAHPYESIAIAFAVGLLTGILFRRR